MDVQQNKNWFLLRKVVIDITVLCFVGIPILLFFYIGSANERGFFCDDESLKYSFKNSTITSGVLYGVGYSLPIFIMCLTEFIRLRDYKGGEQRVILGLDIPAWVWESYRCVGVFLFGCACQQLTTDIAKYTIGRLRPHFFEVCNPSIDCSLPENQNRYIETFTCLGTNKNLLKQMRLSFPSGHSSFSVFTMVFLALYLQTRFTWKGSKLLRHIMQLIVIVMAWYTCLSRVSDNKHHWGDVLGGFVIGFFYAITIFAYLYKPLSLGTRYSALMESQALPRPIN
ncbi:unnamed protein product [Pieris brassicae]|uniref:Phosphatidic acid phosphatase type 2/haloperoxidase domain-containing protein n=1 Tax=Pieris brassicae TaxID=7116 RepID=A0A9P0TKL5_PIEBR|nr:unnamed protein product [Pieris brassicae]